MLLTHVVGVACGIYNSRAAVQQIQVRAQYDGLDFSVTDQIL